MFTPRRQSSPSASSSGSSSSSHSPRSSTHNWSDQSLLLPLSSSFPISSRYHQKIRGSSRRRIILLAAVILISITVLFRRRIPTPPRTDVIYEHLKEKISSIKGEPKVTLDPTTSCRLDLSSLQHYNLTPDITYARRYIKQKPFEHGRNPRGGLSWVDDMNESVFTGFDYLDSTKSGIINLDTCHTKPLSMYYRNQAKPTDAKDLVFGLATTSERLLNLTSTLAHWLANTNAHLIVIVPTGPLVPDVRESMQNHSIRATILTSNEAFLINYFKLVEAFHMHASGSKWFTFIDDDTHYFSLERFNNILKGYDSGREHYLGTVTEDLRQMRGEGIFAFGGAGATVSRALLERLHQYYYGCLFSQASWEPGDVRLKRCIYQNTETKLTMVEGLHQVDLIGETHGIMEGPRPPINWHHYKSWSQMNVSLISSAGQICGGACLFQRWTFPVSDAFGYVSMSMHHGVSIVGYSIGTRPDWGRTELTWANFPDSNFDHSVAPLRMGLIEGRDRFTYRLVGVGHDVDGHVKHTYIKYADKEQEWFRNEEKKKQEEEKREKDRLIAIEKAAKKKADLAAFVKQGGRIRKPLRGQKSKGGKKLFDSVDEATVPAKSWKSAEEHFDGAIDLDDGAALLGKAKPVDEVPSEEIPSRIDEEDDQLAVFESEADAEATALSKAAKSVKSSAAKAVSNSSPESKAAVAMKEAAKLAQKGDETWQKRSTATLFDEVLELIYL